MKNKRSDNVVDNTSESKKSKSDAPKSDPLYHYFLQRIIDTTGRKEIIGLWNLILVSKDKKVLNARIQDEIPHSRKETLHHRVRIPAGYKNVWIFFRTDSSDPACIVESVEEGETVVSVWNTLMKKEKKDFLKESLDYADEEDVERIKENAKSKSPEDYFKFLDYHFALYRVNLETDLDKEGLTSVYEF